MSTLYVDTINEKTSGNGIIIPGHILNVTHQAYTSTTSINNTSYVTLDSPLDGTFSATNKQASSKFHIEVYFSPIAHAVTWESHTFRIQVSTDGGTSYSDVSYHSNQIYNTTEGNGTSFSCKAVYTSSSTVGTAHKFRVQVKGHTSGRYFAPNRYDDGSGEQTDQPSSFITVLEVGV
jgi:hypothetical protein